MIYEIIKGKNLDNGKIIIQIIQMSNDGLAIEYAKWFYQQTIGT